MKLYKFQKMGVKTLLSNNENYLLADEQGLGKTVQVAAYFKIRPESLPAVIVCPASLKLNWCREIEKWTGVRAYMIEGRTPHPMSDDFVSQYPVWVINYDILGVEDKGERQAENERKLYCKQHNYQYREKTLPVYGWCDEINRHSFQTIICDEVQYIAEADTLRSKGVQKICDNNARKIFLSGTPYETRTSQFFTALHILNKKMFPSRWKYLMRYCGAKKTFFGWQFKGLTNGEELHNKISKFMIRRLKKDVLRELPPKQRIVVPVMVGNAERKAYDLAENELVDALNDRRINPLAKLAYLKKVSAKVKKNAVIQWVKDYLTVNDKLVVFVYHTEIYELFMNEFKKICVGVNGSVRNDLRQREVDRFQKDNKIRLFIGQISACCTGLTLTAANAVCFVEFGRSYPQMVQAEDRVHRISQKSDSVFAYYLLLEDSIDEIVMQTINEHSGDINKVMDNVDTNMFSDDLNVEVLRKFRNRRK